MNKVTRIAIIVVIIITTLATALFYALKSKPAAPTNLPEVKVSSPSKPAPPVQQSAPQEIPTLPADNKQAIDSELQGIEQTLQTTEASLSTDIQDGELGL